MKDKVARDDIASLRHEVTELMISLKAAGELNQQDICAITDFLNVEHKRTPARPSITKLVKKKKAK